MKATLNIELKTIIIIVTIFIIILSGGFGWMSNRLEKTNKNLEEQKILTEALNDKLEITKNILNETVSSKLSLQYELDKLMKMNIEYSDNQKELLDKISKLSYENYLISAALIRTEIKLDSVLMKNANIGYLLPFPFTLSTNATNPDTDGVFDLEWTNSEFANSYSIYEYSHIITEINGSLTPILLTTTDMTTQLSSYSTGVYYFRAVAINDHGSTLSNCIMVTVSIPSGGGIPGYNIFFVIIAGLGISIVMLKKWKTLRIIK